MTAKTAGVLALAFMGFFAPGFEIPASDEEIYTAKLVLEDGRPFPSVPLALPPLNGNSCLPAICIRLERVRRGAQ